MPISRQLARPPALSPVRPGPGFGFNADGSLFTVGPNPNGQIYNLQPVADAQGRSLVDVYAGLGPQPQLLFPRHAEPAGTLVELRQG